MKSVLIMEGGNNMTDLLLLIIIGLISNASNWYWVIICTYLIVEFIITMCKFFKFIKKDDE